MSFTNAQLATKISDLIAFWSTFNEQYKDWLGGEVAGGPSNDGLYPLTDYTGNEDLVACPAKLADNVSGYVGDAAASETAAAASAAAALASETEATAQAVIATAQAVLADADRVAAELAETGAVDAKVTAIAQAAAAVVSAAAALVSENAALVSENAAEAWANTAEDTLVANPPGDGATEYSALHWAAKAAGFSINEALYALIDGSRPFADLTVTDVFVTDADGGTDLSGTFPTMNLGNGPFTAGEANLHIDHITGAGESNEYLFLLASNGAKRFAVQRDGDMEFFSYIQIPGGDSIRWSGANTRVEGAASGPITMHTHDGTERVEVTNTGVNITGAAAVTGAVTGSNLNVSNWDTAYGWGDHSGLYEIADAAIVKSDENETITGNWQFTVESIADFTLHRDHATNASGIKFSNTTGVTGYLGSTMATPFNVYSAAAAVLAYVNTSGDIYADGDLHPQNSATNYVSATRVSTWQTAYGWGDHAGLYEAIDADIVKADVAETITSGWTFANNIVMSVAQPKFIFNETDAPTDEQNSMFRQQGGIFGFYSASDAAQSTPVSALFTIGRTATVWDTITWNADEHWMYLGGGTTDGLRFFNSTDQVIIRPRDSAGTGWDSAADFSYDRSAARWTFDTALVANGVVFNATNHGNWETAYGWGDWAGHAHELDELDATGITDGYVLTADGAGNAVWEAAAGGGGSDTPWTEAHDAAGYALDNVGDFTLQDATGSDTVAFVMDGTSLDITSAYGGSIVFREQGSVVVNNSQLQITNTDYSSNFSSHLNFSTGGDYYLSSHSSGVHVLRHWVTGSTFVNRFHMNSSRMLMDTTVEFHAYGGIEVSSSSDFSVDTSGALTTGQDMTVNADIDVTGAVNMGAASLLSANTTGAAKFSIDHTGASASGAGGGLRLRQDDGAAMASGHQLGYILFAGAEDASSTYNYSATIGSLATENWDASNNGANLIFSVTAIGDTTRAIAMTLASTGLDVVGAVTGSNLNVSNWDTAYGWGDHAGLYSVSAHNHSGTYEPVDADILRADTADSVSALMKFTYASEPAPSALESVLSANFLHIDGKEAIDGSDTWMRLNQNGEFSAGVYTPGHMLVGGELEVAGLLDVNGNITGDGATIISGIETINIDSTGDITKTSHGNYLYHKSTAYDNDQNGEVTFSTSGPSGGTTGDIWFEYTA